MSSNLFSGWLTGWKVIGQYLGVEADTARKWHEESGMPVFNTPGNLKAALPYLLDQWLIGANKKLYKVCPLCGHHQNL